MCLRPIPRLPRRMSETVEAAMPIALAAEAGDASFCEQVPQHFRSGEIRYRMMGRLISLDQVGKDIEIIVLPSREISTDRQLVRNLGGAVEIAL